MNVKTLLDRNANISTIGAVMMVAFIGFFLVLVLSRISLMGKILKQMRLRKLI